jgi:ADP-ribose pyrophosphatase
MEGKNHDHLKWKELGRKKVFNGPIFDLYSAQRQSPEGDTTQFLLMDTPDWVNIVPLLKDEEGRDCFLMVRQYRQGSCTLTLEFPGGVIDDGEDHRTAAERELLEETGHRAERLDLIGEINPNPAYMSNCCYTYLAQGLDHVAEQSLDQHEYVDSELVPIKMVEKQMGMGIQTHAIMVVALFWYQRWRLEN